MSLGVASVLWRRIAAGSTEAIAGETIGAAYGHLAALPSEAAPAKTIADLGTEADARFQARTRLAAYFNLLSVSHRTPPTRVPILTCWWRLDALNSPSASDVLGTDPSAVIQVDSSTVVDQFANVCSVYSPHDVATLQAFSTGNDKKPHRRACALMVMKANEAARYFENSGRLRRGAPATSKSFTKAMLPAHTSTAAATRAAELLKQKAMASLDGL